MSNRYRHKYHGHEVEAWQNVEGSAIPEWLQGRGAGTVGGVLHVLFGDPESPELLRVPRRWYVLRYVDSKDRLHATWPANFHDLYQPVYDDEHLPF